MMTQCVSVLVWDVLNRVLFTITNTGMITWFIANMNMTVNRIVIRTVTVFNSF